MSQLVTVRSMTSSRNNATPVKRSLSRRIGVLLAATAGVLALAAAPVGAQTYSDGGDGSTGQDTDTNPSPTTTPTTPTTTPTTPTTPGATDPGTGGNGGDEVVAQADDNGALAFTGSDSRSLALIGAGIVTAGGLLVVSSRRKVELPA